MPGPERPVLEFRVLDAGSAYRHELEQVLRQAGEEMPGHPALRPPQGPELEPAHRGVFLAAYVRGVLTATGSYRTYPGDSSGETAELTRMYVSLDNRRSGTGRALLEELEQRAIDDGYRYVLVAADPERRAARALYEITGYHLLSAGARPPGPPVYRKELRRPAAD
jgi:GNAT superfamily N-acetyltransferase